MCSVVMPVYNTRAEYLKEAVESILNQTLGDFEFLIVDDGSKPYVRETLESYGDARIRYFRQEKQSGAAAARNRALDAARGEFIAFMDSDDVSLPERLQRQVEHLRAHPEINCLGTAYKIFNGKGFKKAPSVPHDHEGIVSYLLFCGCAFCQSSVMLRRSVLEQPTPLRYRPHFEVSQDCALWFDMIDRAHFAMLNDELVHYRTHPHSVSQRAHNLQVRKMAEAQAELLERYSGRAFKCAETWPRLLEGTTLSHEEYEDLSDMLLQAAEALQGKAGYRAESVFSALRQRVRKVFYRTHSLRGQWELLHLPLRKHVHLSPWLCVYYLIVKGLLCRQR